jgi:hypothetical protein
MHPVGPPWYGTRHPRKDSQDNIGKVPLAAGADCNLHRLLERSYGWSRGEPEGIGA